MMSPDNDASGRVQDLFVRRRLYSLTICTADTRRSTDFTPIVPVFLQQEPYMA